MKEYERMQLEEEWSEHVDVGNSQEKAAYAAFR